MKAINTTKNKTGDDDYLTRLLSYLREKFDERIMHLIPIRQTVFYLKSEKNTYIMKGYQSNQRLKLQEAFTATLRKEGFSKTYMYLTRPFKDELFFEGVYFGCIEYIPPHKTPFSFQSEKNRREGAELLEQFHDTTALFTARYQTLLPKGQLIKKWIERYNQFSNNLSFLQYFINEPFISEMLSWANWSLAGMEKNHRFFSREPTVILHGDVAHHNFLRDQKGILHLIDFDLITIGCPALDFLQYANRILPNLDWSYEKLKSLKQIQRYLQEEGFLYALAYPSDIFREWNRMIREKSYQDDVKFKQIIDLSVGQFYTRKKFINYLKKRLE